MERYDHVYVRNGTASLFLAFEPLAGWRHVAVTDGRKRADWALFVRELVEGRYRDAAEVVPVMDQLDTHSPASLYEIFPPEEARRLTDRPEIHRTPRHGSWLTMAEIEFNALAPRPAGAGQRQADAGAPRGGLGAAAERRRGRGRLAFHRSYIRFPIGAVGNLHHVIPHCNDGRRIRAASGLPNLIICLTHPR